MDAVLFGNSWKLFLVFMLAAAALTSGCATAVRGTTEPVTFVSDPAGAKMETTTGLTCTTPCTLEVPRSDTFTATFTLNNQTEKVFVDTEISESAGATTAANVLLTPIIAIPVAVAVDATSGANLDHTPNPVKVTFKNSTTAKVGSAEVDQAVQTETPAQETEDSGTDGSALAATSTIAPEKPPESATDRIRVWLTLDVNARTNTNCKGVTEFVPNAALNDETPTWHGIEYQRAPGLNVKTRLRPNGTTVAVDVWVNSKSRPESDVVTVQLSSLEPGTSGRTFSTQTLETDGLSHCGPYVVYASVEQVS